MEKFYNSLMRQITVVCRRSKLHSVMVLCTLMVTMLFQSALAQVHAPMSSTNNNGTAIQSSNPDIVPASFYDLLSLEQDRVANPDLDPSISCSGLKVILVLDESYSIAQANQQSAVRNGALALANALLGTSAQLRIIEFSNTASVVNLGGTTVNSSFITNFTSYLRINGNTSYNSQNYNPTLSGCVGYTNWHAALNAVGGQEGQLVIFFTDGNPTAYNVSPNTGCYQSNNNPGTLCTNNTIRYSTDGPTVTRALGKAVCMANEIKTAGKHMFVVGVGSDINVDNMKLISDNDNFATTPNIFTADYSIGNFSSLASQLTAAVNAICGTNLSIIKSVSQTPVCPGNDVTFTITVTNTGNNGYNANNTVLTDIVPANYSNIQVLSPANGWTLVGNTITYNMGNLTPNQSKTLSFKAKVNSTIGVLNTATAVASNANQVSASATPIFETVPPTIKCPANKTLYVNNNCQVNIHPDQTGWATGKDNCTPTNQLDITYSDDVIIPCLGSKTITRTWKVKDKVGNFVTCVQIISVLDTISPTITPPANVNVTCASDVPPVNVNTVSANDNCSTAAVVHIGDEIINQTCPNKYTIKRKFKAVDACGNESPIVTQTITVKDEVKPVIQPLPTIEANCQNPLPQPNPSIVIANDNCGGLVTIEHISDTPSGSGCTYTITRKYKATDVCGNFDYVYQTINVIDNTPPTASNPAAIQVGCGSFPGPDVSVITDEADGCGTPFVEFYMDEAPYALGCFESKVRWYKVIDNCGNFIYVSQILTRTNDSTPPTINAPANFSLVGCGAEWPSSLEATWSDNCSAGGTIYATGGQIFNAYCSQTRAYTFTVTDGCGNNQVANTIVTRVLDTTPPTINTPEPIVLEGCAASFPDTLSALWLDNCSSGGYVYGVVDSTVVSGCTEVRYYSFTATDDCLNNSTSYTTITRVYDIEAPSINAPANYTIPGCNGNWPSSLSASWSDNCSAGGLVEGLPGEVTENGCSQSRVYTFHITDDCGNSQWAYTTVTRTYDTTPPTIYTYGDFSVGCNSDWPTEISADWNDNCSSGGAVSGVPGDIITIGCTQHITYTFSVMDQCGNQQTNTVTVSRMYDTEAPSITTPNNIILEGCSALFPDSLVGSYTDSCLGNGVVSGYPDSTFVSGCTEVRKYKFTITDACNNTAVAYSSVTRVYDVEAPVIMAPSDLYVEECNGNWPDTLSATWTDNCSAGGTIYGVPGSITNNNCSQSRVYTFSVTDDCGNLQTAYTTVTRQFNQATPTIVAIPNYQLQVCNENWPTLQTSWYNSCQESGTVTGVPGNVVNNDCSQSRTYTFTVTDNCGQSAQTSTTVTRYYDVTPPVFVHIPTIEATCNENINFIQPTVQDICSSVLITYSDTTIYANAVCGQFTTYSKGGWHAPVNSVPGGYRNANFSSAFPLGLNIGCANASYTFTTANAIASFLPAGGQPAALANGTHLTNPTAISNNLAAQLLAATLNVGFDAYDPNFGAANGFLGDLQFASGAFAGMTVSEVMQIANDVLGGCSTDYTPSALSSAMEIINLSFHEGTENTGDLVCENNNSCTYTVKRTWTAIDGCGNSSTAIQAVTITDEEAPVIDAPANFTMEGCNTEWPEFLTADWTDNCAEGGEVNGLPGDVTTNGCSQSRVYTFTVTDDCDNTQVATTTVTRIFDTLAPVIDTPESYTLPSCNASFPTSFVAQWSDNCSQGGFISAQYLTTVTEGCTQVNYYVFSVSDLCMNYATDTMTITRHFDFEVPVINAPANQMLEGCNAEWPTLEASWTDNCAAGGNVNGVPGELAFEGCYQQRIYTFSVTDDCGNTGYAYTTISRIFDTIPPVVIAPANYALQGCNGEWPTGLVAQWSDNCSGAGTVTGVAGDVTANGCTESRTYSFTYTDECNNTTVAYTTVTRTWDIMAPTVLSEITPKFYQCGAQIVYETPVFIDNCTLASVTLLSQDTTFLEHGYEIVRIFRGTDACGNFTNDAHYIYVIDDSVPVLINIPADIYAQCGEIPAPAIVYGQDNCDVELEVDFDEEIIEEGCYKLITRTWTVTDYEGNVTSHTQIIQFNDTIAPVVIYAPQSITLECGQPLPVDVPLFADNCDDSLSIVFDSLITPLSCGMQITRKWTAYDNCGNSTQVNQIITIVDTTNPYIVSAPASEITVSCDEDVPAFIVEFADNCDTQLDVNSISGLNNVTECSYQIERKATATDDCGNSISFTQIVYVVDTIQPVVLYTPGNITVECSDDLPLLDEATFSDNCDESLYLQYSDSTNELLCGYQLIRVWTATDNCGNSTSATQIITVVDTTPPVVITELEPVTVECGDEIPAPVQISAYDNCSEVYIDVNQEITAIDSCGFETYKVTYTITDECDNATEVYYYIYVVDTTVPELTGCPEDLLLSCNDELPAPAEVSAWDSCEGNLEVIVEDFVFGKAPTEGALSDCKLLTPARPANNPCAYPVDWSMALFNLPVSHRFYQVTDGHIARFPDGTMHLTARLHNAYNNTSGWDVDVWFANEKDWTAFSSQAFPTNFKADCGSIAANHQDWLYYVLQAGAGAELTGYGSYNGSVLNLVHAPANKYFGFQLGDGANNYNAADNGFGGWFSYSGSFIVNGIPYGANGNISGAGDLAFEMECCLDYYVVRQWTATDCSGNSNTCSQTITFDSSLLADSPDMVTLPSDEVTNDSKLEVSVAPNPANNNTLFTFKTKENAQTTLEVFDTVGKKVADVFMGTVEAGVEYKVNYNVEALSTGIYVYRLTNGTAIEVGKLIIGK
jgi:uncharacterized repeat protein (TIGR01451 family)